MAGGIIEGVKLWAETVIGATGYPGIALLTGLGCANIPIPSEVVLPFAGTLAATGRLNVHLAALTGTLGSVLGSAVSYGVGAFLGKDFLAKYGKYVFMRTSEIEHAEAWYQKYGLASTLWGRLIPVVRSFVSLPAGIYRADFRTFLLYAFIGSLPWCYGLTLLGFFLGRHWRTIEPYLKLLDALVIAVAAVLIVRFILNRFGHAKSSVAP